MAQITSELHAMATIPAAFYAAVIIPSEMRAVARIPAELYSAATIPSNLHDIYFLIYLLAASCTL